MTFNRWCLAALAACALTSAAGYAAGRWLDRQTAQEWAKKWDTPA
jgi:membrane protein DedA with SNARE-associated domain